VIIGKNASEILGASLTEITLEKPVLGVTKGLEVSALKSGKLHQAGIKEGFIILIVNDENLTTPGQLEKKVESAMKNNPDDRGLFIKGLYPNGKIVYYAVNLND
jgi:S1-C subfamily serine protease